MSSKTGNSKFYAVAHGRQTGVFSSWYADCLSYPSRVSVWLIPGHTDRAECQTQVTGYSGARFKSFPTKEAAEAFIRGNGRAPAVIPPSAVSAPAASIQSKIVPMYLSSTETGAVEPAPKRRKLTAAVDAPSMSPFRHQQSPFLVAYTDGACQGNGTQSATAGIGAVLYDADNQPIKTISEKLPLSSRQTNQRAEIYAAIRLLGSSERSFRRSNSVFAAQSFFAHCRGS